MSNNFIKSLEFTLKWEGGYVNDPVDPGGETKWGISKKAHPELDIKNMTVAEAGEVYHDQYWNANHCDEMQMPLAAAVFDTFVNFSYSTAKMLTRGECTWKDVVARRKAFRGERVKANPPMQKYLKGWLNRDNDLGKFCQIWEQDHGNS